MICIRRRTFYTTLLGLGITLLLLWASAGAWLPFFGEWLALPADATPRGQVIVVLGGGGQQRLLHGITLFKELEADEIWYTGNLTPTTNMSFVDPDFARTYATERGVAADAVRLLHSTSTWEDGLAIAQTAQAQSVTEVVVVTNHTHSRRALCMLHHHLDPLGVTITFSPPASDDFDPSRWWATEEGLFFTVQEWIKFGYYWLNYGIAPWQC